MDFKDYYEILGVPPNAERKAIQQTFRQLARKHHPDVNPGNKEAEEKFKTINEAYQVLSDVKQRKKYDELRAQYQQWQQTGGQGRRDFDWQNWSAQADQGARVQYADPQDMEDLFGSASPYSDFFSNIFGGIRQMDELHRKVHLEALAIAFPLAMLLLMLLGLLQLAIPLSPDDWSYRHVWFFLPMFYFLGLAFTWRRYQ